MFLSDEVVYLQMQKTGSTHVTEVLQKYCHGSQERKHSQLRDYDEYREKLIVSSIRNPWDWYVSLWAFGCLGLGGLREYIDGLPRSEWRAARNHHDLISMVVFPFRLVSRLVQDPDWRTLYSDATNEANFRRWLKLIMGSEGRRIGKEGYASSPVKNVIGLMTYRYLALTTEYRHWISQGRKCQTYAELEQFAHKHGIVGTVLRMENLNEDLLALLNRVGVAVSAMDAATWGKDNRSLHRRYPDYYDDETIGLVASRDRFIVDRFGYTVARTQSPEHSRTR
jgi:hypothetical protein